MDGGTIAVDFFPKCFYFWLKLLMRGGIRGRSDDVGCDPVGGVLAWSERWESGSVYSWLFGSNDSEAQSVPVSHGHHPRSRLQQHSRDLSATLFSRKHCWPGLCTGVDSNRLLSKRAKVPDGGFFYRCEYYGELFGGGGGVARLRSHPPSPLSLQRRFTPRHRSHYRRLSALNPPTRVQRQNSRCTLNLKSFWFTWSLSTVPLFLSL